MSEFGPSFEDLGIDPETAGLKDGKEKVSEQPSSVPTSPAQVLSRRGINAIRGFSLETPSSEHSEPSKEQEKPSGETPQTEISNSTETETETKS